MKKTITIDEYPVLGLIELIENALEYTCIVAGGFPQDCLLGYKPKDLDLFVYVGSGFVAFENGICLEKELRSRGLGIRPLDYQYPLSSKRYVIETGMDQDIDLVLMNKYIRAPEDLVNEFDMVMSQCWLKRDEDAFKICTAPQFYDLYKHGILGYFPDKTFATLDDKDSHLGKIVKRFPDLLPIALDSAAYAVERPRCEIDDDIPF